MRHSVRRAAALAAALLAVPVVASASSAHVDRTDRVRAAIMGGQARNVILLVGDGMGDSEITIARNYAVGAAGRLALDTLPLTGAYTTYAVNKDNPSLPDYVTDSAASGTGWATGHKSYNGAISVLPDGRPMPTVLELAKAAGYQTGDVTTAELQDATPAVLASHVVDRDCKGPQSMSACPSNAKENGGAGSIAEQMVATRPDVMLGGGAKYVDQTVQAGPFAGKTVRDQALATGYRIVGDAASLAAADATKPLLGVFASGNLDLEWTGPKPTPTGTEPGTCTPNTARTASQPHLAQMASKAISFLDARSRGRGPGPGPGHGQGKGFFLQIEGASIDKQDHAANPCGQIGENIAFDAAVKVALNYQATHPDTLVVVTADHGHTSQIVETGTTTAGVTATLITKDGAPMTISYATSPAGQSQQHTGTQVRIAAKGPQATSVLGVTDQTELFFTMTRALGIRR